MPGYQRIPSDDRWDIVNYVRYLNDQKGGRAVSAATRSERQLRGDPARSAARARRSRAAC